MDDSLWALLRCPRCGGTLAGDRLRALRCTHAGCALSAPDAFPVIQGQPVLIDFAESIVDREALLKREAQSAVARGRPGIRRQLSRLIWGRNAVTGRHAAEIVDTLRGGPVVPTLLVVGGGSVGNGAEALYSADGVRVVGFDVYASPHTGFVADGHRIPLPNESVDAVWIQAVLEHVLDPPSVVEEVWRVLRSDGIVYAETPFIQQVHEGPFDFTRFTESGHRWLFRKFTCRKSGVVLGPGTAAVWSILYLWLALTRHRRVAEILTLPFAWLRIADTWTSGRCASAGASAVFFMGAKSDTAMKPREIVEFYGRDRGR